MKTFEDIINGSNEGIEVGPVVVDNHGLWIKAICWTDDPEAMDWPAVFDIESSWDSGIGAAIGRYDNMHRELDPYIDCLIKEISTRFGGTWYYDAADCAIEQSEATR